jgi:molybdopterin-binding protein
MAISDIVGGPADVKLGATTAEATIGNTTGGVTATITPQNRERIVDKYGSTALAIIHTGDECRVTVPWSEWAAATLNEVYDPGADAGSFKGIGRTAGYIYSTQSMVITPYLTADAGDTVEFFKTTPIGEVSMAFNNDDDRILEVEYAALGKTDETDGHLIGKMNLA